MFCVFCVPGDAACFGKRREGPSHRYDHLPSPRKVNSCETDQTGVIKVCIINSRVTLILMSPKHKSILPHNTAVPASKTPIPSTMDSGRVTLHPQHPPLQPPPSTPPQQQAAPPLATPLLSSTLSFAFLRPLTPALVSTTYSLHVWTQLKTLLKELIFMQK